MISEFRSWYKEGTEEAIEKYLAILKHDYDLDIVDARRWLEERCFFDSNHLLQPGAHRFSVRFSQDRFSQSNGTDEEGLEQM